MIGLLLIANVVPIYLRVDARLAVVSILVVIGLIGAYTAAHALISRRLFTPPPAIAAIAALALLVALYVAGGPGGPVFGNGEGELAAVTFLGVSLLIAALRADSGCEVMSIPAAVLGKHTELACLVFSPVDKLERKLRGKPADQRHQ